MNSLKSRRKMNATFLAAAARGGRVRGCMSRRRGAILSIEMMMLLSILIPLTFAITEFSLLWSARHTLEAATYEAARAAAMPSFDEPTARAAAEAAADRVLADPDFQSQREITVTFEVDPAGRGFVTVNIRLPMTAAAPDLLEIIGISIEDKFLTASTVARRE